MKKFDHAGYNKNLKDIARKLRNDSTPAEIKLWKELLRAKKMLGYQFLRQRPVMNYIADFMCKELQLIIEVDRESHDDYQWVKDQSRQKELEEAGFTVLRFTDEEIFRDIENVSRVIEHWVEGHSPTSWYRPVTSLIPFGEIHYSSGFRIWNSFTMGEIKKRVVLKDYPPHLVKGLVITPHPLPGRSPRCLEYDVRQIDC